MNVFAFKTIPKIKILSNKVNHYKVPNCKNCKYNEQFGNTPVCTKFKYSSVKLENKEFNYYIDSETCREDINLCGPDGLYFELR